MLNVPGAPSSVMDRLVLWLDRSPTLGFAISRVAFAVAATWQIMAMFSNEPDFARTAHWLQAGVWIWTLTDIAQPLVTPPLGLVLRPLFLVIDIILFLTATLLCEPLQIAALACLFFVAWSVSDRFGRGSIIVLAACLVLSLLVRGYYEILIALNDNPGTQPLRRLSHTGDFELQSHSIMKRLGKIGSTAHLLNLSIN